MSKKKKRRKNGHVENNGEGKSDGAEAVWSSDICKRKRQRKRSGRVIMFRVAIW